MKNPRPEPQMDKETNLNYLVLSKILFLIYFLNNLQCLLFFNSSQNSKSIGIINWSIKVSWELKMLSQIKKHVCIVFIRYLLNIFQVNHLLIAFQSFLFTSQQFIYLPKMVKVHSIKLFQCFCFFQTFNSLNLIINFLI